MKIFSWVLCLSMLAIAPLVKAQSPSPDFCQKYPFNARCKQNTPLRERPFPRNNLDRSKIIDNLTIEVVEKYLRKISIERQNQQKFYVHIVSVRQQMDLNAKEFAWLIATINTAPSYRIRG